MGLIHIVLLRTYQQVFLKSEIRRGNTIILALKHQIMKEVSLNYSFQNHMQNFKELAYESNINVSYVKIRHAEQFFYYINTSPSLNELLSQNTNKSILQQKSIMILSGSTWSGIFKLPTQLILSSPIYSQESVIGGIGIVIPLYHLQDHLKKSQQVGLLYIFINTLFITYIGYRRLFRVIVKPLEKLVDRAEGYNEDDPMFILYEKEGNDFNRLSKALNSMLFRISSDKLKLKSSID
ncbi:MAG: hypothetical protein HQK77_09990, partial [Desulfobacterales bacterium]|nr:hypothetical protein [Desulfobacterales bacterium]